MPIAPLIDLRTLRARFENLEAAYDRVCNKNLLLQVEMRHLSRASGKNLDRLGKAEARAQSAEGALSAAGSRPAKLARLILRCERFLYRISYPRCPSCLLEPLPHRWNCRLEKLTTAILDELPVDP